MSKLKILQIWYDYIIKRLAPNLLAVLNPDYILKLQTLKLFKAGAFNYGGFEHHLKPVHA